MIPTRIDMDVAARPSWIGVEMSLGFGIFAGIVLVDLVSTLDTVLSPCRYQCGRGKSTRLPKVPAHLLYFPTRRVFGTC